MSAVTLPPSDASAEQIAQTSKTLSDVELLKRFLQTGDEAAFRSIVHRYGQLVFAVALRIVRDRHTAEDVTQAAFLVLARDARKIRRFASLSSWLHGVTLRLARNSLRRRNREQVCSAVMELETTTDSLTEIQESFEQQVLDEELQQLPTRYREPLILHFLQGHSYQETADILGVSLGVVEGRMKRGKRELQLRLTKRGVGLSAALVALSWSQECAANVIQGEVCKSLAVNGFAAFEGTAFSPLCSPEAVYLATKETTMLALTKILLTTCGLTLAVSTGWLGHDTLQTLWSGGIAIDSAGESVETQVAQLGEFESDDVRHDSILRGNFTQDLDPFGEVTKNTPHAASDLAPPSEPLGRFNAMPQNTPLLTVERMQTPQIQKIEAVLAQEVDNWEFQEVPLTDFAQFLSDLNQVPVMLDKVQLQDEGLSEDEPVSFVSNLPGITTHDAIQIMLEELHLTYIVKNGMLVLTTQTYAEQFLETRVYDVRPLNVTDPENLADVIVHSTSGPWNYNDGVGGEVSYFNGSFVIRTHQQSHREVEALLNQLARLALNRPQNPNSFQSGAFYSEAADSMGSRRLPAKSSATQDGFKVRNPVQADPDVGF